ncbi:MAG: MalY/PatB family protein [Culicoidibacterales bacterium]
MNIEAFCRAYGVSRQGTDCLKWDALDVRFGDAHLLPLWVADMEFKAPTPVIDALITRVNHGVFGYGITPKLYFEHFAKWQWQRHQISLQPAWLRHSPGVVMSLYWLLEIFTAPNDAVLIFNPSYYPFYEAISQTKRQLVTSTLLNTNGHYHIDFVNLEQLFSQKKVKLLIHCSPHNPTGRVWSKTELTKLYHLCATHDVIIISDEIHQDLIIGSQKFVSGVQVDDYSYNKLIIVNSASKTFNLASLLNSHIIIPDDDLRQQYDQHIKRYNQVELSVLGQIAAMSAYEVGMSWCDDLLAVIKHNYQYVKLTFAQHLPQIIIANLEGTYLLWIDMSAYFSEVNLAFFIKNKCGLAVDYGHWFGEGFGGFIRLNLATLPEHVIAATENIIKQINVHTQVNK